MMTGPRNGTVGENMNDIVYGRLPKFHNVFLGRDPGTLKSEIVKKTFTINLFGFETLKLKIRRLKLWKPTARDRSNALHRASIQEGDQRSRGECGTLQQLYAPFALQCHSSLCLQRVPVQMRSRVIQCRTEFWSGIRVHQLDIPEKTKIND